ncbi:ankyrin, partial [Lentithecium fluviatile CBS 122367]
GQKATRKLLLERGANINARDEYGDAPLSRVIKHQYRQTPLLRAAIYGYEAIVRRLLDEGVDVNEKDGYRQTALLGAAMYGHEAVVKLLLEEGADISSCDIWGETPLSEAKKGRHKAVVNLLL